MVDIHRRRVLRGLGALTIPSMTGCTSLKHCVFGDGVKTNRSGRLAPKVPVFDAHAHFFNASDLQAGGYLMGPVLNGQLKYNRSRAIDKLVDHLGKLVQRVGSVVAPSARAEITGLDKRREVGEVVSLREKGSVEHISEYEFASKHFYDLLTKEEKDELNIYYKEAKAEKFARNNLVPTSSEVKLIGNNFTEDTIYDALLESENDSNSFIGLDEVASKVSFVGRMLVKRSTNLATYQEAYSRSSYVSVVRVSDVSATPALKTSL